jgi:hypothetical protein
VFIVTLAGVRNMDTIDDPVRQYIPNLWNSMRKEGVLYTNLVNSNFSFHAPSVNAINTGRTYPFYSEDFRPLTGSRHVVLTPTIFQYVRKKYALPGHKLWLMGHWFPRQAGLRTGRFGSGTYPCQMSFSLNGHFLAPKELTDILTEQELKFLELSDKAKGSNIPTYAQWDTAGEIQYRFFRKIVGKYRPKLVHYVMGDPESAHYCTYARYVIALKRCDEKLFDMLRTIRTDPFYKDNTYLIVTVDHGRNQYYMQHLPCVENPGDPACSRVWLYVYGPDIKRGAVLSRPVTHTDIFATVAEIMKVKTHASEGKVLKDCFTGKKAGRPFL